MRDSNDYPDDVELGLDDDEQEDRFAVEMVTERCGCVVFPWELHDVGDCLQAQADNRGHEEGGEG